MSKVEMTNGTIVLSFDSLEEFDDAIGGIAGAFYRATLEDEEEFECARCGQDVKPSEHPEIGCDL